MRLSGKGRHARKRGLRVSRIAGLLAACMVVVAAVLTARADMASTSVSRNTTVSRGITPGAGGILEHGYSRDRAAFQASMAHYRHLLHVQHERYISSQAAGSVTETGLPFNEPASSSAPAVLSSAAAYARRFIGAPYAWAGTGPAYDCSGLVMTVYAHFGVALEHSAEWDYRNGTPVPAGDAVPGDLAVFLSGGYAYHVGIYEGDGMMVSALDYSLGVTLSPLSYGGDDYVFVAFT